VRFYGQNAVKNSNEILRIITELSRATPIEILHEESGVEVIRDDACELSQKLHLETEVTKTHNMAVRTA
jgi:hypothetical protein